MEPWLRRCVNGRYRRSTRRNLRTRARIARHHVFIAIKNMCALHTPDIALAQLQLFEAGRENGFAIWATGIYIHMLYKECRTSARLASVQANPNIACLPDAQVNP